MSDLVLACISLTTAERNLELAQQAVEREAAVFRGLLPIRQIARLAKLSPATVSNFFRGRLVVSSDNALRLARFAEKELV